MTPDKKPETLRRVSWSISIRPALREAVEKIAAEENNNPSRIVERAIQRYLDTEGFRFPHLANDPDTDTDH
jgi:predicted transcriptional regulator